MRYDDASGSFSAVTGNPDARDDADVLPAGSHGPATGNTITGAGTLTGQAGADLVSDGTGKIVALEGAGGSDTSDGGSLQVGGRFGNLTMDADGNYRYQPTVETPNGARDVFRYTLADDAGARDAATLTIEIGREPKKIDANAQQIIPGPDGVVTLPPGVELSDIHVVGRNLVIDMPDGTQMIIIDGAVFVPQLVLNGVEVPATNLAALLIDAEPQPAGGIPQSSGGNFDVPVPPLDPGVPLGDLIPPTELVFTPPEFHDIGQFVDREPEAGVATAQLDDDAQEGGNPLSNVGDDPGGDSASGVLPGSGGDGSIEWALLSTGTLPAGFSYAAQGNGDIWVLQGADHVMTITVDPSTGEYTVDQLVALDHPAGGDENNLIFTINYSVTDQDGDTAIGTLTINVDDDTPSVSVQAGSDANVILTTDDADTIGAASDTAVTTANFSGVFSGTTVAFGADGSGPGTSSTYSLAVTGSNSGLTSHGATINLFVVGGVVVGTTAGSAGAIDAGNTIFTVSTTNTGIVTLTQFQQIDHPIAQDPSATGAPFADQFISMVDGLVTLTRSETVVDGDGDQVTGSASVSIGANLHFTDDGPTIGLADRGEDQLIVDETDFTINATGNFAANFSANFGADGPAVGGGISYALGINAGVTGLVDTLTGQAVVLSVVGGQVVGTAGAGGPVVFTVSVNGSGVVTLDQQRAVVHDDPTDPDEPGVSAATLNADNLVTLTATATDFDGDTASQTLNIGRDLHFEDDGPNVSNLTPGPGVILDETTGAIAGTAGGMTSISATSAGAVISATSAFGADGPAAVGATVYGLSLSGGGATIASGLQTAVGDFAITLNLVDSTHITGTYNGSNVAFTITMNANGTITVQQNVPLEHLIDGSSAAAHDDALDLVLDGQLTNLVNATITIKDGDGDTATGSVGIGNLIVFEDDGPSINVTAGPDAAVLLQTQDPETIGGASDTAASTANFSGVFGATSSGGADGSASVVGTYTLGVSASGVDSGLDQGGASIFLYVISGKVVGSTSATLGGVNAGNTVFDVGVSGTGIVTLTQYSQIDHPLAGDPTPSGTPFVDHILSMADGLVTLTFSSTVTDNDGDTATDSETVNIGANLQFADDGPDISAVLTGTQIRIDETDGVVAAGGEVDPAGGNLGTVTMSAVSLFTVSNVHVSADAPTTNSYALTLSSQGVASGLLLSTTNAPIFLYNIGGVISGSTSATVGGVNAGNTVFTASIDSGTGAVTLTQFFAVEHGNTASFDEDSTGLNAGVLNITVTATDFDGDTDSASVDLGSVIRFEDDGPSINVTAGSDSAVLIQTQDHDTIGAATDTASSSAAFGGVFGLTSAGGSDGAATTPSLSYVLGVPGAGASGVDSGLDQTGANIYLYVIGGKVVGSTSATLAGVTVGNTVFDVGVSGTGVVTLTQYSQIDHPIAGDPSPTITPFADHLISMADGLVTLTANASITDNDGDTAVDSETVNIGANLQFADDGPIATNDTDTIVGGNGPATGNVITGVDIPGGDANVTDGNPDTVNADTPGTITRIQSVNVPANVDTSYDINGNLVVLGQYGTLTINSDGSYSYLRTSAAGGVTDTFTYTLTDRDGDTATATLAIGIQDNFPLLPDPALIRLDDDVIPAAGGNLDGPGDDNPDTVPGNVVNGTLVGSGGDAPLTYNFTGLNTLPAGFSIGAGSDADTLLINQGATLVMTIQLNQATGAFTVTQNAPMLHLADNGGPEDNIENNFVFSIGVEVEDADNDVEPATITINVDDDTPTINVTKGDDSAVTLTTDDAQTIGGASDTAQSTANFSGVFGLTQSAGADGTAAPATLSFALDVTGYTGPAGIDSNLNQGGNNIYLYEIGGKVVGSTSATLAGVDAGNTVFDVGVSGTGVVTLTQYSQIDHVGGDPTPTGGPPFADHIVSIADGLITLTASASLTDNDGDTVTDSEVANIGANLRFTDDGPSATIVTTGQTVSLDESAGNQVDSNDVTGPIVAFAGVANVGDDLDVAGTGPIQFAANASALVAATGSAYGADGAGTTLFSLSVAPGGVDSGLDTTAGVNIFLFLESGVVVGRVGATAGVAAAGPAAFALAINPTTGAVSMVEYLSINHPNAANPDDSVSITNTAVQAVVTVTDFDGDTATNSVNIGSLISFQDSAPIMTAAQNMNIQNSGDVAHTAAFAFNLGADGANVSNDVITNVTGSATVGGVAVTNWVLTPNVDAAGNPSPETATTASYRFTFDYPIGGGNTAQATGTLVFNKVAGTYTIDLLNPIQGVTTILQTAEGTLFQGYEFGTSTPDGSQPAISVTQIQDLAGTANDIFVQFTSVSEPSSGTGDDNLEVTTWVPGANNPPPVAAGGDTSWSAGQLFNQVDGWVSTSNSANGVDGDTIQGGEVLDFSLVQGANPTGNLAQPSTFAQASAMFLKFDGIGAGEDMIVILKLYDPNTNTYTTRAIMVENGDIQKGPGVGPGQYSGVTLDNNDGLVIIESNDYNNPGENWVIVGAQIAGSDEGVTGTAINLNAAIGAGGDSDADNNGTLDTDALGFASDTDDGPFKISSIGFLTTSTTPQNAQLDFNVTVTDGDGDSITQAISATVTAAADSTSAATIPAANTTVAPVVVDLNGDGVHFLAASDGVTYDYGHGSVATAWVAPEDGILVRDANGNGTVDDASEFVFGGIGLTDLQALAVQYGSTLDANDADFAKFAVWQDANSNGVAEAGEVQSLTALGIASISLTSDGISYEAANGDVTVAGTGSYTKSDGSSGALADAIFQTGSVSLDDQRTLSAANNNSVLVAAIAAAGLGASSAAAANDHAPAKPDAVVEPQLVAESSGAAQGSDAGSDDASRSALAGETREAVDVQPQGGSSSHPAEAAASNSLTADAGHAPQAPAALLEGTDTSDQSAPAQSSFTSAAVGMPSAEMLIAANANALVIEGPGQNTAEVGRVLFDALAGGGHGPNLDAVIDAAANQANGSLAVIDALASHGLAAVSGWDMASVASFTGGHAAFTMEHMTLHVDAVQAVA